MLFIINLFSTNSFPTSSFTISSTNPYSLAVSASIQVSLSINSDKVFLSAFVLLKYVSIILFLTLSSISTVFCISWLFPKAKVIGLWIINKAFLGILTVSQALVIIVAALAANPSIFAITLALWFLRVFAIATALNTLPPGLFICKVIFSTSPRFSISCLNTLSDISSQYSSLPMLP